MTTETEDAKARQERRAAAGKIAAEILKKQKDKRAEVNAEAERRTSGAERRPTPTQDENDLAALGAGVLEKEPDGSPPEVTEERTAEAAGAAAPYRTRAAQPAARATPAKKSE
jgi:hypothetical protein